MNLGISTVRYDKLDAMPCELPAVHPGLVKACEPATDNTLTLLAVPVSKLLWHAAPGRVDLASDVEGA